MYRDFWLNSSHSIRFSPTESIRFGSNVYRFDIAIASSALDSEIFSICEDSSADLMILRAPSTRVKLGAMLSRLESKRAFQADTLVYYELDTSKFGALYNGDTEIFRLQSTDLDRVEQFKNLIKQTFHDYTNHYSSNPNLDGFSVEDGYLEWALGLLADSSCNSFVRCTNPNYIDGWMTVKQDGDYVEMIIGGSNPLARGTGTYMKLVNAIVLYYLNFGTKYIRVSTQITNTDVIGVWQKNGFKFLGSINTFHIEKT